MYVYRLTIRFYTPTLREEGGYLDLPSVRKFNFVTKVKSGGLRVLWTDTFLGLFIYCMQGEGSNKNFTFLLFLLLVYQES